MKKFAIIMILFSVAVSCDAQTATPTPTPTHNPVLEVCQYCSANPRYATINAALDDAVTGDTILIRWENHEYNESIVIDKSITLTSDGSGDSLPVIQADVNDNSGTQAVIDVTADGVEISHLKIRNSDPYYYSGPGTPVPSPDVSDEVTMDREAGIRIRGACATITDCVVTRCRVGILVDSTACGSVTIENCRIGQKYAGVDPYWFFPVHPGIHQGNFFGIVHLGTSGGSVPGSRALSSLKIAGCTIEGNRFYGIVFRDGSGTSVTGNRIRFNGTREILSNPRNLGCGGLLLLAASESASRPDPSAGDGSEVTGNTIQWNWNRQVLRETRNSSEWQVIETLPGNEMGPNPVLYDRRASQGKSAGAPFTDPSPTRTRPCPYPRKCR